MNAIFSFMWFLIGTIWVLAGKPFMEVAACFLICAVFAGAHELYEIRTELESWENE